MKPTWDALAQEYATSDKVVVADVDCTAEGKDLCERFGVQGFPTIKYFNPPDEEGEDYEGVLARSAEPDDKLKTAIESIERDIPRTFSMHAEFESRAGQARLRRLLIALAARDGDTGYWQSFAKIAATLLMVVDDEADAFWLMVTVVDDIMPKGFYGDSIDPMMQEIRRLVSYLETALPSLHAHLSSIHVDVSSLGFIAWDGHHANLSPETQNWPFSVLRFWDKNTGICAGAMPYLRDFPATTYQA